MAPIQQPLNLAHGSLVKQLVSPGSLYGDTAWAGPNDLPWPLHLGVGEFGKRMEISDGWVCVGQHCPPGPSSSSLQCALSMSITDGTVWSFIEMTFLDLDLK